MEKAKSALLPALDIGKCDDIILPFAEYGFHILEILKDLQRDEGTDGYLDRLVTWVAQYSDNLKNIVGVEATVPVMTKREKEILEFIVEGKTNRQIASELFVAEVTVRKNITSIYRKLDVNGRASAVKKAVEQKIV